MNLEYVIQCFKEALKEHSIMNIEYFIECFKEALEDIFYLLDLELSDEDEEKFVEIFKNKLMKEKP